MCRYYKNLHEHNALNFRIKMAILKFQLNHLQIGHWYPRFSIELTVFETNELFNSTEKKTLAVILSCYFINPANFKMKQAYC